MSNTKEGDVKDENKVQVKPSVVLAKSKELDVHVPVTSGNAKSTRQYPGSQKHQTIPGEPKAPDNTQRAKSTRQYLEG